MHAENLAFLNELLEEVADEHAKNNVGVIVVHIVGRQVKFDCLNTQIEFDERKTTVNDKVLSP